MKIYKLTKEHRQRISNALKGKNTWSRGRKLTEEHKRKLSISLKEKTHGQKAEN